MKKFYFFFMYFIFFSCSERAKNEKVIKDAKQLIEKAGESKESTLNLPLGFQFGWTEEYSKKYVDSLKKVGVVMVDDFPRFTYKYPQYKGLKADVELFFVDDCLARMAFQHKYKTENILESTKEFAELLKHYIYLSGSTRLKYKIPVTGIDDESNWDEVDLAIKDNLVVMYKKIKYSTFLQEEKVYVFSNQPKAKKISEYMTQKQAERGYSRFEEIKETENWVKEHEEEIENAAYKMKVENNSSDGSVWQVKQYLDKNLKDPDSYKSIEWGKVMRNSEGYQVRHKYRAKNSFGGYVIEEYIYQIDIEGNVVGIVK